MADGPRRTLKVASVVGRVFEAPVLPGAYPELGTLDEVLERLGRAPRRRPHRPRPRPEHAYLFKHVATQEVAYESLPFGLRARLHGRIGTRFESSDPDGVDRRLTSSPTTLLAERRRRAEAAVPGPGCRRGADRLRERLGDPYLSGLCRSRWRTGRRSRHSWKPPRSSRSSASSRPGRGGRREARSAAEARAN